MNNDYTHITFVIDRSGSMATCWDDTIGGLSSFITEQKKLADKCTFSLYNFDNRVEASLDFADMSIISENVEDLGIFPRGGTALYDAVGQAITETGAKLKDLTESERPAKVVFVVQTDGYENSSREFKASDIKQMVETQTEDFNWDFMFLGADESSVLDASDRLGFVACNTTVYNTVNTTSAYDTFNTKLGNVRSMSLDTYKSAVAFNEDEKAVLNKKS